METEELTKAEEIADMIVNGNISDARSWLSWMDRLTTLDVLAALTYRGSFTLDEALTKLRRVLVG